MTSFPTSVKSFATIVDLVDSVLASHQNERGDEITAIENYLIETATEKTVSGGVLTVDKSRHKVQPESGTTDDIDTITGIPDGGILHLYASDAGTDTLTLKSGTGNLSCVGASDVAISRGFAICYRSGSTVYVAGGGGGGGAYGGLFPEDSTMLNGKISVTVASNNITVALKTLAGADPSTTDPIYVRIGDTVRSVTAALSVTKNAGTNWFNSGGADFATVESDYFVYLIWNTTPATDVIDIGFARIPYGSVYSNFSGTSTNAKYLANGNGSAPTSTDNVVNIGRFAATLSASASYNWSVPTFTSSNLKQYPTRETRWLTWNPTDAGGGLVGWSSDPASSVYQYKYIGDACFVAVRQGAAATSDSTSTTISCPMYAATVSGHIWSNTARAIDNGGTAAFGVMQVQSAATVMDFFPTAAGGAWTGSGSKRILAGELMYQI